MKRISLTQYLIEEQRLHNNIPAELRLLLEVVARACKTISHCLLYTSPSPRDRQKSRMPSSA